MTGPEVHRRVVFVADDLGMNAAMDRGIAWAREHGPLGGVSLLVTGETSTTAGAWAAECGLAVGLHLAFCAAHPVSPTGDLPVLAKSGSLPSSVFHLAARRVPQDELLREGERQLVRFHDLVGRSPDFLNTHQHAQVLPRVFDVVLALAARHRIARVRSPIDRAPFRPRLGPRHLRRWAWPLVSLAARIQADRIRAAGLRAPDAIIGGQDAELLSLGRLDALWPAVTEIGTLEVVMHPRWSSAERVALGAPVLRDQLEADGRVVIDFRDV